MRQRVLETSLGFAAVAWLCCVAGCFSIGMQVEYWCGEIDDSFKPVMVYGGTQADIGIIVEGSFTHWDRCTLPAAIGLVDLPFSLCMDTVLLPLTIPESIAGALALRRSPREAIE